MVLLLALALWCYDSISVMSSLSASPSWHWCHCHLQLHNIIASTGIITSLLVLVSASQYHCQCHRISAIALLLASASQSHCKHLHLGITTKIGVTVRVSVITVYICHGITYNVCILASLLISALQHLS